MGPFRETAVHLPQDVAACAEARHCNTLRERELHCLFDASTAVSLFLCDHPLGRINPEMTPGAGL